MSNALSQDSELAAASWLREPLDADHQDELVAWHGRLPKPPTSASPSASSRAAAGSLQRICCPPAASRVRDLLWLQGSGGLLMAMRPGGSGQLRQSFLRQRQLPFLRARLELSQPLSSFPRLEQVVWLPRADGPLRGVVRRGARIPLAVPAGAS